MVRPVHRHPGAFFQSLIPARVRELTLNRVVYAVPWGFRKMLRHIQKRYLIPLHLPLIITENGFAVKDEAKMRKEDCLNDVQRVNYYKGYLAELSAAVNEDALNCIGYFAWTIAEYVKPHRWSRRLRFADPRFSAHSNWEWVSLKCD